MGRPDDPVRLANPCRRSRGWRKRGRPQMTQGLYSTSGFDPATSLVSGLGERSPLSFVGGQAMWRLQKKQASLTKYGLKAQYAQSQRAASQFKETSERNRQRSE